MTDTAAASPAEGEASRRLACGHGIEVPSDGRLRLHLQSHGHRGTRASRSAKDTARHQYSEDRVTAHVRERQVDAVRGRIDRDRVSLGRPVPAELYQGAASLLEHR